MSPPREAVFETFVRERRGALVRTATALTAGDRHLAEDIVQTALVRCYVSAPRRALEPASLYAYTRRAVVNALTDHHRRPFMRRERVAETVPDRASTPMDDGADPALLRALAALPTGMRAAVVLRHVEGLSVEETADALGCSTGTVKSQTARGLDKLRAALSDTSTDPTIDPTEQGDMTCRT